MSKTYFFNIRIVAISPEEGITFLVHKMLNMGFGFFDQKGVGGNNYFPEEYLSAQEIITYFLGTSENFAYLYATYQDTFFTVILGEDRKESQVFLGLNFANYPWTKTFVNGCFEPEEIDFGRCIRLLLEVSAGHKIMFLKACTRV